MDDVDLQTLSKTNLEFQSLCNDPVVWDQLKTQIHIPRLDHRLYKSPSRLSRDTLANKLILRSCGSPRILNRQIQQGSYINGPTGVLLFEAQRMIEKEFKSKSLKDRLQKRKTMDEVVESGVFSQGTTRFWYLPVAHAAMKSGGYHPRILPIQLELQKQFTEIKLRRRLQTRPSVESLDKRKVIKPDSAIAIMICPSIREKIRFFENALGSSPLA